MNTLTHLTHIQDPDIPSKLQAELKQKAATLAGRSDKVVRSLFDAGKGLMVPKQANGQGESSIQEAYYTISLPYRITSILTMTFYYID